MQVHYSGQRWQHSWKAVGHQQCLISVPPPCQKWMSKAATNKRKEPDSSSTSLPPAKARKHDSHLYTDDNPSTTLHGTGFQDVVAAEKTIDLVKKRSLTYQFQVINTMFHRAKHHPHPNARMEAAMEVFNEWLQQYQAKKQQLPDYKKASRPVVQLCLNVIDSKQFVPENDELLPSEHFQQALTWARAYINMPKGKRLANTLTTQDAQEPDMESLRLSNLQRLVPEDANELQNGLWCHSAGKDKQISDLHLQWVLWAYTPAEKQVMAFLKSLKH